MTELEQQHFIGEFPGVAFLRRDIYANLTWIAALNGHDLDATAQEIRARIVEECGDKVDWHRAAVGCMNDVLEAARKINRHVTVLGRETAYSKEETRWRNFAARCAIVAADLAQVE